MLGRTTIRALGMVEFHPQFCTLYWCTRTGVIIFLVSAVYCAQYEELDSSSDFATVNSKNQNSPSNKNREGINWKNFDQQNLTEEFFETSTKPGQRSSPADYEDYGYYDDFDLSAVGPEVLVDLGPEELVLSLDQDTPERRRKPVKDGFNRDQEAQLLRLHNSYRGNVTPPAADMSFMEWDDELAKVAQEWANGCQFRHGFPQNSYPGIMGQNLYTGFDPTGVRALLLWFEERDHYDLKTLQCSAEYCGHYTQMAWGESSLVGCGMKRCGIRKFLIVCHYSPPGNIAGSLPFKIGKPCSQCQSDHGGLCTNNLCVTEEQCARNQESCDPECPLECHNCGILNLTTCKCSCADGWDSLDCSRRCRNDHNGCGERNGFPTLTYCSMYEHNVGNVFCRKMCGRCRDIEDLNATSTCCNGVLCDDGYVLYQEDGGCECRLLCPGPNCYGDTETTDKSTSVEDSGPQYAGIWTEGEVPVRQNISKEYNGTTYENASDEDNGSQHPRKGIHPILLFSIIVSFATST